MLRHTVEQADRDYYKFSLLYISILVLFCDQYLTSSFDQFFVSDHTQYFIILRKVHLKTTFLNIVVPEREKEKETKRE